MSKLFITAIDTDAGKTIITGLLAKYFLEKGKTVITQKIAQTGCKQISEDIEKHRKIMGIPLQNIDKNGKTCPYLFEYPASPHLSSRMENKSINTKNIINLANELQKQYEIVLMEGVGGLMVPITDNYMVLNFIADNNLDTILVATSKLGSINHTLLSLEVMKQKNINVKMLVYNKLDNKESPITLDTENYLKKYIANNFQQTHFVTAPFFMNDYNTNFLKNTL